MSDPFSTRLRRYIPWDDYRTLEIEQSSQSLIDIPYTDDDTHRQRIEKLEVMESEFGFVYFGERQWLQSCQNHRLQTAYDDWVSGELSRTVFAEGLTYQSDTYLGPCWTGYTEDLSLVWQPRELAVRAVKCTDITLLLRGGGVLPHNHQLRLAFAILHNLAYHLHQAGSRAPGSFMLDQLVVQQDEYRWDMLLINEYSASWLLRFLGPVIID